MSTKGFTKLLVESWSNAARVVRIAVILGGVHTVFEHDTNADRSLVSESFALDPYDHVLPTSVTASIPAATRRGELYVRISVTWSNAIVRRLSAGYLTDGKTISWPPGVYEAFDEGPGLIRVITGTNPAPGAAILEAVPTNAKWRFRSILLTFETDVTVTNREVILFFDDGATTFSTVFAHIIQPASLTWDYLWKPGIFEFTNTVARVQVQAPSDPVDLFQGYRVNVSARAFQAGDDMSAPILQVEEWIQE